MTTAPRVTVTMGVYNGGGALTAAVESILSQTFGDFEFLIVDDGSRDSSLDVLKGYEQADRRVRVIEQENSGLTKALIRGCGEARGEFIARQDADDLSKPDRLRQLVELMEREPMLAFCSSWVEHLGPAGELMEIIRRPLDPAEATRRLRHDRLGPPAHGSIMMRAEAYRRAGGYRPQFYYAQDSDLWLRLAESGLIGYVPEALYSYRWSSGQISTAHSALQHEFGEIGRACSAVRCRGGDEAEMLARAAALTATCSAAHLSKSAPPGASEAALSYRIGVALLKRGDPRARAYLRRAVSMRRTDVRAWMRLLQSEAGTRVSGLFDVLRRRGA